MKDLANLLRVDFIAGKKYLRHFRVTQDSRERLAELMRQCGRKFTQARHSQQVGNLAAMGLCFHSYPLLARAQLTPELRRAQYITAELITHHENDTEGEQTWRREPLGISPDDKCGLSGCSRDKKHHTAPNAQRRRTVSAPPHSDRGIQDENDQGA